MYRGKKTARCLLTPWCRRQTLSKRQGLRKKLEEPRFYRYGMAVDFSCARRQRVGALQPPGQPAQGTVHPVDGRTAIEPVMRDQPRRNGSQRFWQLIAMFKQQAIHAVDENRPFLCREALPVLNEKVIEGDIKQDTGVAPERWREQFAQVPGQWVVIGEAINLPVVPHALTEARRQALVCQRPLDKISRDIPHAMQWIGTG